jgi:ABC-2 type transport system ATP-binding protein
LLSGVYNQEGGNLTIDGDTVYDNVETKKRVFFVNDETAQFSGYTLTELKNFYKHYYPNFSEELFEKMRLTINLPTDKKISTFSKGMKRQAIVIIALACQTDYLLLDEAFDGLDPTMRIIVKRMLVDAMIDRQLTTIISSHNLKEINELCDTVALLHNGKIVFSRDLDSVKGNIHKVQVVFSQSNENQSQDYTIEELAGEGLEILHFEKSQSVYHIIVKGDTELVKKKIQEKNPVVLDIIPLSLEEIFIYEMEVLGYDFNSLENK